MYLLAKIYIVIIPIQTHIKKLFIGENNFIQVKNINKKNKSSTYNNYLFRIFKSILYNKKIYVKKK